MSKVRINDLARELEVKSKAILDTLPLVGVTEKKTHSSSLEENEAEKVRVYLRSAGEGSSTGKSSSRPARGEDEIKTKIDLSNISRPGDVLKAITQRKEAVAPPMPPRPAAPVVPQAPVSAAPQVEKPAPVTAAPVAAPPAPAYVPRIILPPQPSQRPAPPIIHKNPAVSPPAASSPVTAAPIAAPPARPTPPPVSPTPTAPTISASAPA